MAGWVERCVLPWRLWRLVWVSGCFGVAGILALHCEPKISALFGHASHMRARRVPWQKKSEKREGKDFMRLVMKVDG